MPSMVEGARGTLGHPPIAPLPPVVPGLDPGTQQGSPHAAHLAQ